MKRNDVQQNFLQQTGAWAFVISSAALAGDSDAAMAVGRANAAVVESASVTLSGTTFNLGSFTNSQSTSGPLLRAVSPPPSGASATGADGGGGTQGGTAAQGAAGTGAAPSAANSATVTVTRKADGSLSLSGGTGITIAVSQSDAGVKLDFN